MLTLTSDASGRSDELTALGQKGKCMLSVRTGARIKKKTGEKKTLVACAGFNSPHHMLSQF
jgi:hypothetical protein